MPLLDVVIRIVSAMILGGLIGLERETRDRTAGFRTHILVAIGASVFTLASSYGDDSTSFDSHRITAQVVSGIGFLGAGAIIRHGVTVRGLTTAAGLWAAAAVGITCGQGFYSAALVTTALVLVSLYGLRFIEDRIIYRHVGPSVGVRVHFRRPGYTPLTVLLSALDQAHVAVKEVAVVKGADDTDTLRFRLQLPRSMTRVALTEIITSLDEVESVNLD
ncbi:MAG: MgtC/SapB family protein [Thermoleophilia bacterium]|jgi:putative Mg2+ transporter-C (MgtC) family protein